MLGSYFNEIDPFCATWLRNLWPDAEIDKRSISDITSPVDAVRQHYFAGIGGWEFALQLAGWPDDWPIWTGSCPCQPFSVAGKGQSHEDERDLWPAFFRLIAIGRPPVIVGEQVNGAITYGWLDRVCDDLEGIGYAVGAAVLPASGVGAPHIRQRLYWVAVSQGYGSRDEYVCGDGAATNQEIRSGEQDRGGCGADGVALAQSANGRRGSQSIESTARIWRRGLGRNGAVGRMADAEMRGQRIHRSAPRISGHPELGIETSRLGDPQCSRPEGRENQSGGQGGGRSSGGPSVSVRVANADRTESARYREHGGSGPSQPEPESHWAASGSIYCQDGRYRRVPLEPGFQPLADSGRFGNPRINPELSSRIGALQAAGNAIVIPLAAEFVRAVMDIMLG